MTKPTISPFGYFMRPTSSATTLESGDVVSNDGRRGTLLGFSIIRGYAVVQYDDRDTELLVHPEKLERETMTSESNKFEAFLQRLGVNFETRCTFWNDDSCSTEPYQVVVTWYPPARIARLWREMPNAPERIELAHVFGATVMQATARAEDQPALRAALECPERICGWRFNADADRYDPVLSPVAVEAS